MERRRFLKQSILTASALAISSELKAYERLQSKKEVNSITILHTNDTHSNIDPFPVNHAKFPGIGGVAARFELIEKIRKEEEQVLLLDAGDIFQGTPYFNRFGGELEMKVMQKMGYDAATMGNHDFDGTMEGFVKAKQHANFPFLCANYDFSKTAIDGHTKAYHVFQKGKIKVGVFGIGVELKGLVPDKLFGETVYLDPIDIAKDMVKKLQAEKCDLIICLSHLGYEQPGEKVSDLQLAKKTSGIDLIIGGHTHTFLEKPTSVMNESGMITLVNQVGWAGLNLGRLDFDIEKKWNVKESSLVICN